MKNWSGHLRWEPFKIFKPDSEEAIVKLVQSALQQKRKIRIIGSGHSFTPLFHTTDFLLSLDNYQGIIAIDSDKKQVTVKAGTKISQLGAPLAKVGLALENLGDIDVQSIAGAISTGTHGTGLGFGNISTQIVGIKMVNGLGQLVHLSPNKEADLFKAAQISLGALGIITEITLQCVTAYKLELQIAQKRLEEVLDNHSQLNAENRNFEFFWFPNTPFVLSKTSNITLLPADERSFKDYMQEILLENYAFKLICELSYYFPSITRRLSSFAASTVSPHQKINESHKVYATTRIVRFNEMEYNVPLEAYREVKQELVRWVNKHNYDILFPVENRFVRGDDIYLSPAYQRDSAYIAVHAYHKKDFKRYFSALEDIFKAYEGRPHWGKMHQLTKKELMARYPAFETFQKIRAQQDPHQVLLSPYLSTLFI